MTPLAVFVRTLMKTSAVFLGAGWIVLHPSLDWSSRSSSVNAELAPREAALAGLRVALSDQDPAVRRQAAEALANIRSGRPAFAADRLQTRTVKELVTDLTDGDAVVRTRAACDLREAGDRATDAIQPLVALLADGTRVDPEVCGRERWNTHRREPTTPGEQAARALSSIGSRAFEPVLSTLRSRTWTARKNAAWALGALDDSRAVQALVAALRDPEPSVREQVAWALNAIGDARATDALLPLLKDSDVGVRRQAAWAIGAIGR